MPRKLTVTARTIFPPPHKAQIVSEGESQGRHLDTGGGFTRKHDRWGPNGQPPLHLGPSQRRLPRTFLDHVRSASALSALKKSLVANLSAKRQLSVAKLSAKRIFSLAKRDFLVANGRMHMAADFSSPANGLFVFALKHSQTWKVLGLSLSVENAFQIDKMRNSPPPPPR